MDWVASTSGLQKLHSSGVKFGAITQGLTLKRHIEATLGSGNIRDAVRLPVGEDLFEWLAVNTVDFYNAVSVLFGTLDEYCTVHSCSLMTAGSKVLCLTHAPIIRAQRTHPLDHTRGSDVPLPSACGSYFDWQIQTHPYYVTERASGAG